MKHKGIVYLTGVRNEYTDRLAARFWGDLPLGLLAQPGTRRYIHSRYPWVAIDNGCFSESGRCRFRLDDYLAMIRGAVKIHGQNLLFATAQDVPMDWKQTLAKSLPVLSKIRAQRCPAALVAQDGATTKTLPWREFDVLFIGGSTEWKLGPAAARLAREASERGVWVHMGRVNSRKRLVYAQEIGCDSVDGTALLYRGGRRGVCGLLAWLKAAWSPERVQK